MQKQIAGLPSVNAVEDVLLTEEAAMRTAGLNAHQITEGISRRGRQWRSDGGAPGKPVAVDSLSQNFSEIVAPAIEALFNTAVRALAAHSMFARQVTLALDPTDVETSARFGGAGHVTRKKIRATRHRQHSRRADLLVHSGVVSEPGA